MPDEKNTAFIISTIDWPSDWYNVGIASSPVAAMEMLKAQNPEHHGWKLTDEIENSGTANRCRRIEVHAKHPHGIDSGWDLVEYEIYA